MSTSIYLELYSNSTRLANSSTPTNDGNIRRSLFTFNLVFRMKKDDAKGSYFPFVILREWHSLEDDLEFQVAPLD
jgi:hypothetical protein